VKKQNGPGRAGNSLLENTRSFLSRRPLSIWSVFSFTILPATAIDDQRSCLVKRMGKQLFGKNISIVDDVYHPLQLGAPFDGEGIHDNGRRSYKAEFRVI